VPHDIVPDAVMLELDKAADVLVIDAGMRLPQ
jgi:hypothetical protein